MHKQSSIPLVDILMHYKITAVTDNQLFSCLTIFYALYALWFVCENALNISFYKTVIQLHIHKINIEKKEESM